MDLINNKFGLDLINELKENGISENEIVETIIKEIESGEDIYYFKDYYNKSHANKLQNGSGNSYGQRGVPGGSSGTPPDGFHYSRGK